MSDEIDLRPIFENTHNGAGIWGTFRWLTNLAYSVCWIVTLPVELVLNRKMGPRYAGLLPLTASFFVLGSFFAVSTGYRSSWTPQTADPMAVLKANTVLFVAEGVFFVAVLRNRFANWLRFRSEKQVHSLSNGIPFWLNPPTFASMRVAKGSKTVQMVAAGNVGFRQEGASIRLVRHWRSLARDALADVSAGSQTNTARLRFVSRETINRVLAACPDNEWRLLAALSRFGGFRCPSEHLALRWEDIDWQRGRIMIRSSKTEAHENQETREIPLFPELLPYLRQAKSEASPTAEYVVTERYRHPDGYGRTGLNLGTQFKRIIRRAGIEPWPRVWHNLRASRQTELAERFPLHVVCKWLGNTTTVATQHYLTIRDSDYENALKPEESGPSNALQNALQQAAETSRTERQR